MTGDQKTIVYFDDEVEPAPLGDNESLPSRETTPESSEAEEDEEELSATFVKSNIIQTVLRSKVKMMDVLRRRQQGKVVPAQGSESPREDELARARKISFAAAAATRFRGGVSSRRNSGGAGSEAQAATESSSAALKLRSASRKVRAAVMSTRKRGNDGCLVKTTKQKERRRRRIRDLNGGQAIRVKFDLTAHDVVESRPWFEFYLRHDNTFGVAWTGIRISLYAYTVFRFPFRASFAHGIHSLYCYWDIIPDSFFVADIFLLHFFTYESVETSEVVQDLRMVRAYYRRWKKKLDAAPSFWLDLLAIVPFYATRPFPEYVIQIASLPRALRIVKLFKWFSRSEVDIYTDYRLIALFKFSIMLLGAAHWVGCIWFLMARVRDFKHTTWLAQYERVIYQEEGEDAEEKYNHPKSVWKNYQLSLFYGFYSMTAFGYPTMPDNDAECIYAIFLCIAQLIYNAYILGTLFHYVVKSDKGIENHRKRMKGVETYAESRKLPAELVGRIRRYFAFANNKMDSRQQNAVISQMPASLVAKIARWEHLDLVAGAETFKGVPEQYMTMLLVKLRSRFLEPGEVLFKLGDMSKELCFIQSGTVDEFEDAGFRRRIRSISHGVVGEVSFFLGIIQPCVVAACAGSDVVLQSISKEDYEEISNAYSEGHSITINNILRQLNLGDSGIETAPEAEKSHKVVEEGMSAYREKVRSAVTVTLKRQKDDELSTMIDAASEGDLDTIRRVIHKGFDINQGDYDFRTMLHLAAAEGNVRVVRLLLDEGADVGVSDRWSNTPLHDAVRGDHQQVAHLLSSNGASLTYDDAAGVLCNLVAAEDFDGLKNNIQYGTPVNS